MLLFKRFVLECVNFLYGFLFLVLNKDFNKCKYIYYLILYCYFYYFEGIVFVDFVEILLFLFNFNEFGTVYVLSLICVCIGISYFWVVLFYIIYVNCIVDVRVIFLFRLVGKFNDFLVVLKINK